jgi:hypothetical protein
LVAIYAALTSEGYDPSILWTSIGVIFVLGGDAVLQELCGSLALAPPAGRKSD